MPFLDQVASNLSHSYGTSPPNQSSVNDRSKRAIAAMSHSDSIPIKITVKSKKIPENHHKKKSRSPLLKSPENPRKSHIETHLLSARKSW
jgi:hypothetical protein